MPSETAAPYNDYKYIQKIEGKNPPAVRIDTIEKFAKVFKISCSKLLDF